MDASYRICSVPELTHEEADDLPAQDPLRVRWLGSRVRQAVARTRQWLLGQQASDGSWCAELEGDTILESETILLLAFLGRDALPLARRAAAYLLQKQLPDGGWAMYPGGPMEISGSVKAYFALKLTGHEPGSEPMQRARKAIMANGGADAVNSYTRFLLAMLGQISYEQCPSVPPELMLLPKWFPVNLYAVSAWSRTIIVPLSIVWALRPVCQIGADRGIRELFLREPECWPPLRCPGLKGGVGLFSWDRFFRTVDGLLKWCQRHRFVPLRHRAIAAAEAWMLARFERSDGLGAIYPPILFSLVALRALGYADDSQPVRECFKQLNDLAIEDDAAETTRLQPCKSPVWDTAITLRALAAAGLRSSRSSIRRGVDWLLQRQTTRKGDWAKTVAVEPGGWYFEYANDFYPDVDDTAMALMALQTQFETSRASATALPPDLGLFRLSATDEESCCELSSLQEAAGEVDSLKKSAVAIERGLRWMLAMQNRDGGWGAFDRNNDRQFLCYVPFADHNAMIDPSTPDLTGRVLEALGKLGRRVGDPVVDRAVAYMRSSQEADGSWFGRWGVNYIYGTWQSIIGLIEVGVPTEDPAIVAGVNWFLTHQQSGGGWGESAATYDRPELRGQGTPTASQTAWAILALLAAGREDHIAVTRGIRYLLNSQNKNGTWTETEFTGTGFPRVFYLRYHYYPIYFPLLALSQWATKGMREGVSYSAFSDLLEDADESAESPSTQSLPQRQTQPSSSSCVSPSH